MKRFCIQLLMMLILFEYAQADACTIFNAGRNGKILVGNTEDAPFDNALVWFFPAKEEKYGGVYFNFQSWGNPVPQGGMNDQGLFYDWAALPSRNDIDFPSNLKSSGGFLCMKMLEECATLEEAIALYRSYKDRLLRSGHIMIVDRSGNSAIIEWGRDELSVVEKKDYFQVMTNFNTTVPNIFFAYPCYRYNHLTMTFKRDDEISIDRFCALLDDVDSDGTRWAHTVYSTVFDLQEKRIYLYYLRNYGDVFVIDLDDELRKGAHHYDLKSALSAGVNVRPQ